MQRETALALLGITVIVVIILVAYATQLLRPSTSLAPQETAPPPTTAATTPAGVAPPTLPAPPAGAAPAALATPTVRPMPETPPVIAAPAQSAAMPAPSGALNPAVLPPVPGMGALPPSPSPSPAKATEPTVPEPVRWAQQLVQQERPQWRIRLVTAADIRLGAEGFSVALSGDQLEVAARSPVGWLYGLLEVADRLRAGEPVPSRWQWQPPFPERGWVEPVASLVPSRWTPATLQSIVQQRLRSLAWHRFNRWVLESTGQEPFLTALLTEARTKAPLYGVRVVVWAPLTPAVQAWRQQGGCVVTDRPTPAPTAVLWATDMKALLKADAPLIAAPLQEGHLFAPLLPPALRSVPRPQRARIVLIGGPEGAHEGLFWFDPEWAQAIVRSIRDEGLSGLWLRVRSVPTLWGAMAFAAVFRDSDEPAERRWLRRWVRRWGNRAGQWLAAFRDVSRIMPEVVMLLGTAPDNGRPFRPQFGVPLARFFDRRPVDPAWGTTVLSVPDTVQQAAALERDAVLTASDIAQRLHRRAESALFALTQLPEPAEPDWQQAKRAAMLTAWLGKHFAHKVEAAMAWLQWERGDRTAGRTVVAALDNAVQAWHRAALVASALYGPVNAWAQRLPEWQREAATYRARIAPALP